MTDSASSTPINNHTRRVAVLGDISTRLTRAAGVMLVILVPLVVSPWGADGYNLVKALAAEVLAGMAVIGWVGTRLTTGRPRWMVSVPELPLWAFFLFLLLSTVASADPRLSFFGAPGRYEGLFAYCGYMALFLVGVHFFGSQAGYRTLAGAAGAAAVLASAYGVLQVFIPPLFAGEAFIREWYSGPGIARIPSTLSSPVVFGGYVAFIVPQLLAMSVAQRGSARPRWLAAACLAVIALALTLTRAAWVAAFIGLLIFCIAVGPMAWRRRLVLGAAVAVVVVSSGLLITGVGTPAAIWSHVTLSADAGSGSLAQRMYIWGRTLGLIAHRPWLGWGLDTLGTVFPYERTSLVRVFGPRPTIVDKAHNDLLQMAVSIGVPGALAYAALWGAVAWSAVRMWRRAADAPRVLAAGWLAAITAYLVQIQFSFSVVALAPIVWLLAGAACGWEAGRPE